MSDDKFIVERHGVEVDLSYEHSTVCPRCAKNGRDTSGDNFHVYGLDKNGKYLGGHRKFWIIKHRIFIIGFTVCSIECKF